MKIKHTKNGSAFLNIGCGNIYSSEWNNVDFVKNKDVTYWDIRNGLPYQDSSMDAVYSSHLLEHLSPIEAKNLMGEINRVLKKGGVLRIVVPDFEKICVEYLSCLGCATQNPSAENLLKYDWIMLELIDQMVREKSGGLMREVIDSGNFDKEYVHERVGDIALSGKINNTQSDTKFITWLKKIKKILKTTVIPNKDPRKTGEVHRWMYDRFSMGRLFRDNGFKMVTITEFNKSLIPDWNIYSFDSSKFDQAKQKKPESIYVEGVKE